MQDKDIVTDLHGVVAEDAGVACVAWRCQVWPVRQGEARRGEDASCRREKATQWFTSAATDTLCLLCSFKSEKCKVKNLIVRTRFSWGCCLRHGSPSCCICGLGVLPKAHSSGGTRQKLQTLHGHLHPAGRTNLGPALVQSSSQCLVVTRLNTLTGLK